MPADRHRSASVAARSWPSCSRPCRRSPSRMAELDKWSRDSPGYFVDRPIILDLASVMLDTCGIGQLVEALGGRGIRIMGLEGVEADQLGPSLPPLLKGGPPGERRGAAAAGRVRSGQWGARGGGAATPRAELIADREPDPLRPIR